MFGFRVGHSRFLYVPRVALNNSAGNNTYGNITVGRICHVHNIRFRIFIRMNLTIKLFLDSLYISKDERTLILIWLVLCDIQNLVIELNCKQEIKKT